MLSCPELLSPAGSLEALKYAVMYGADAVYCALPRFGMRAAPVNLTIGELHDGCIFAHARGKKVYLTLNNLPTNDELSELPQYIKDAAEAGVDAFIIADLGVLSLAKQYAPDVDVHFSTQAGITTEQSIVISQLLAQDPLSLFCFYLPLVIVAAMLVVMLIVGFRGNKMYMRHCIRTVRKVKATGNDGDPNNTLDARGGVNTSIAVCLFVCYMLIVNLPLWL